MTLVVKDVPAEICENCGERYFDADVTRELLSLARAAAAEGVVVDVRRYIAVLTLGLAARHRCSRHA